MAALVALGMSGCQKGEPGNGVDGGPITGSRMGLTLELPASFFAPEKTRTQDAMYDDETMVKTVHVWVFNADGTPAEDGDYTVLTRAMFTPGANTEDNNVYTLLKDNYIDVIASKNAHVYVGVNVPGDALVELSGTEAGLLAAFDDVKTLATAEAFTMFSALEIVPLVSYVDGDDTTITEVEVSVGRVASKVVGTTETRTILPTDKDDAEVIFAEDGDEDVVLSYEILEYNVYNEAIDSYLVEPKNTTKSTLNLFDNSYYKADVIDPKPVVNGNKSIEVKDAKGNYNNEEWRKEHLTNLTNMFYIGENKSTAADENGISRVGKTTYAFVTTKVRVNKTAKWNAELNDGEGGIEWDAVGEDGETTDGTEDLYIVTLLDENDAPLGEDPIICLEADWLALEEAGVNATSFIYKESYVHFLVWLNHFETNKADVGRNEFIHLHVEGVTGAVGDFPGYPGDPEDPEKPIDPTEEPNNPDPKDPKDPIDPTPSKLKVVVTVKPWTYKYNGVTLNK